MNIQARRRRTYNVAKVGVNDCLDNTGDDGDRIERSRAFRNVSGQQKVSQ